MENIIIIDFGMGNCWSVQNALNFLGLKSEISNNNEKISNSKCLILPGVGSFDPAINNLSKTELIIDIKNWIKSGKSFLGICLGLQLLFESSDEGTINGLGIVKGQIKKIPQLSDQRIPHVGWCELLPTRKNSLLKVDELNNWVYFVHSYHAVPSNNNLITANVSYGSEKLTAMIERDNLLACQFHPEKSGKTGEKLLRRWVKNIQ